MSESVDVLIVGGGISGLSLAARLAGKRRIAVVEAENFLGTHATGRSAALLVEAYGPPVIRMLTGLSRPFFEAPPPGFSEAPLAKRRGGLVYGGESQMQRLREEFELASRSAEVEWLDSSEVLMHCPLLRPGVAAAGFLEPNALDLDANGLLQGFVRQARGDGALILTAARVERIQRHGGRWVVAAADREIDAAIVVNAAGAWADAVARLAGVRSLRLQPMRRTAAAIGVPEAVAGRLPAHPFVAPVDESFYFKP